MCWGMGKIKVNKYLKIIEAPANRNRGGCSVLDMNGFLLAECGRSFL